MLTESLNSEEARKLYRKLALKTHTDVGGSNGKMEKLNQAKEDGDTSFIDLVKSEFRSEAESISKENNIEVNFKKFIDDIIGKKKEEENATKSNISNLNKYLNWQQDVLGWVEGKNTRCNFESMFLKNGIKRVIPTMMSSSNFSLIIFVEEGYGITLTHAENYNDLEMYKKIIEIVMNRRKK